MSYRDSHIGKGQIYDAELNHNAFDHFIARHEKRIILDIIHRLFPNGIGYYLDFACGTGRIAKILENYSIESYGIDLSESMLKQARIKCMKTKFILQDITIEKYVGPSFDLITAFRFFGNAEDPLRIAAFKKLSQLLKPGGHIIINNHRNPLTIKNIIDVVIGKRNHLNLTNWKLRRQAKKFGLKIVKTVGIGFWLIRGRYFTSAVLNSLIGKFLEPLSRLPLLRLFCPDSVIVFRKPPR